MRTLDVRLAADLMLRAAYMGRLKPGFPSVDRHFRRCVSKSLRFKGSIFVSS